MSQAIVEQFDTRFAKIVFFISMLLLGLHGCANVATAAVSSAPCEIQVPGPGALLTGRSFSIRLRDGREISVVGQNHGDTRIVMDLARLGDDTTSANSKYLAQANGTLAKLSGTLRGFREETEFLRRRSAAGKIDFVALEWGPTIMSLMSSMSKQFVRMARENLAKRQIVNEKLLDDATLVLLGPALYVKSSKIVPVEDDEKMSESLDAVDAAGAAYDELMAKFPKSDARFESWEASFMNTIMNSAIVDTQSAETFVMRNGPGAPTTLRSEAEDYLRKIFTAAQLARSRDRHSVAKLLRQSGSGVLLIGASHVNSVADLLHAHCLAASPAPSAAFGAPTAFFSPSSN